MVSEICQTIGLVFDVIGVFIIAHGLKKVTVKESSPYGIATNMGEILTDLKNEARFGSMFLIVGFVFQILGLWAKPIVDTLF